MPPPAIQLKAVEGNALETDTDLREMRPYQPIEAVLVHAQIERRIPQPHDPRYERRTRRGNRNRGQRTSSTSDSQETSQRLQSFSPGKPSSSSVETAESAQIREESGDGRRKVRECKIKDTRRFASRRLTALRLFRLIPLLAPHLSSNPLIPRDITRLTCSLYTTGKNLGKMDL